MPGDDLDAILAFAWDELRRAAADRDNPLRHVQLATTGAHGWPALRTVILRHAEPQRGQVGFHTDRRSAKVAEMDADTAVALVAHDRRRGLQTRLWGQAELHVADARARAAWARLEPLQRVPYRLANAPGRMLETPAEGDPTEVARDPADPDAGFENFTFVAVRVIRLEWLRLRPAGHRRARFQWNGRWEGSWIAP